MKEIFVYYSCAPYGVGLLGSSNRFIRITLTVNIYDDILLLL